jgi:hypothetical protein
LVDHRKAINRNRRRDNKKYPAPPFRLCLHQRPVGKNFQTPLARFIAVYVGSPRWSPIFHRAKPRYLSLSASLRQCPDPFASDLMAVRKHRRKNLSGPRRSQTDLCGPTAPKLQAACPPRGVPHSEFRASNFPRSHYAAIPGPACGTDEGPIPCRVLPCIQFSCRVKSRNAPSPFGVHASACRRPRPHASHLGGRALAHSIVKDHPGAKTRQNPKSIGSFLLCPSRPPSPTPEAYHFFLTCQF